MPGHIYIFLDTFLDSSVLFERLKYFPGFLNTFLDSLTSLRIQDIFINS